VHLSVAPELLLVADNAYAQKAGNKGDADSAGNCHFALTSSIAGWRLAILHAASIAAKVPANPIATYPIASIMSITTLLCVLERLTVLKAARKTSALCSTNKRQTQMSAAFVTAHKCALPISNGFYQE
jgi:hypothetical protein